MLKLKDVTLFVADGRTDENSYNKSLFAVKQCLAKAEFNKVVFWSAYHTGDSSYGYKKIDPINLSQYNMLLSRDLTDHIDTKYVLIAQHDGFILNPDNWDNEFYKYDYIGAPWSAEATQRPKFRVGNGGFSLRSKRLLDVCKKHFGGTWDNEDWRICVMSRPLFESHGCEFAPIELATKFSIETHLAEFDHDITKRFGFHGPRQFEAVNKAYGLGLK